jgi:hypothetical protein
VGDGAWARTGRTDLARGGLVQHVDDQLAGAPIDPGATAAVVAQPGGEPVRRLELGPLGRQPPLGLAPGHAVGADHIGDRRLVVGE